MQFTTCCICVRLPGFTFAAGKFPEPTVSFVVRALTDEELVSTRHHSSDDPNRR
jgi:hypothetical protein